VSSFRETDDSYQIPTRRLPVIGSVDVIVCGGGPAGISAAVAAARTGSTVLLIEQNGYLGGMATAGLVMIHHGFFSDHLRTLDWILNHYGPPGLAVRGVPLQLIHRVQRNGGALDRICNPLAYAVAAQQLCNEAGVSMLLRTLVVGVEAQADHSSVVLVENKSGRQAVRARVVVDSTGDGDAAVQTGATYAKGRIDGRTQPMTLACVIDNVHTTCFDSWRQEYERGRNIMLQDLLGLQSAQNDAIARGELSDIGGPWCRFYVESDGTVSPSRLWLNALWEYGDATNAEDVTSAEIRSRLRMSEVIRVYAQTLPEFSAARLMSVSHQIGVRDTRRITGNYILSEQDVLSQARFSDSIARGCNRIDVHPPVAGETHRFTQLPDGASYQIPYRCIQVKDAKNILSSGRCISTDHPAMGSVRLMGTAGATGQAAGVAASIAALRAVDTNQIDVLDIQSVLKEQDAVI